jgi:DNA-binding MarR family transcriptional regulator
MNRAAPKKIATIEAVEKRRSRNMRQLLLRTSRIVNRHVVEQLQLRGYSELRSTHTTLLSNIDLAGSTATVAAERAGITKQAMGRLAAELEATGYIRVREDLNDARARLLEFTPIGKKLMMDSFEVMEELERQYAEALGRDQLNAVLEGLAAFVLCMEKDKCAGSIANSLPAARTTGKRQGA